MSSSGGWLHDLCNRIGEKSEIELGIACVYQGNEFIKENINDILYFLLPGGSKKMMFYDKQLIQYWDVIEEDFHPDIVHIHGTEYTHCISYIRKYPKKDYLLTIQGILKRISEENYGALTFLEVILNRTFKENFHLNGMLEQKLLQKKNTRFEKEIIETVQYATGRTLWDKAQMLEINPQLKYYRCNYNLRKTFYSYPKWNIENAERHCIVTGAALSPLKGLDVLIKALAIVKKRYKDVRLIIPGGQTENNRLVSPSGYIKYILKLINKYDLEENVFFVGAQNSEGIARYLTSARLCVIPSAIEGASASLCEAMYLGVPSIAAYRGGMTELLRDKETGFYYDFKEYSVLAQRIMELFENDELALAFSKQVKLEAIKRHDPEKNADDLVMVYYDILRRKPETC